MGIPLSTSSEICLNTLSTPYFSVHLSFTEEDEVQQHSRLQVAIIKSNVNSETCS